MKKLFDVSGKVIFVTGGLGNLGRRFTRALLEQGAKVAVLDRTPLAADAERFFGSKATRSRLQVLKADVTDRASLENAFETVLRKWKNPAGLVNCAAIDIPPDSSAEASGPFENYPESEWDRVMDVNVKGAFLACQVIGSALAKAGKGGSIVNIGSTYGLVSPDQRIYKYRAKKGKPFIKPVAYSVSKSALLNMTRYLAVYWAQKNVRVNTLTLGGVFNHQDREFLKGYEARVPLGRMAGLEEYNGAVLFLLSEASSYMTGSNLIIDGGWTAW